jgi:tetratricopeptide (TPR) repeat protein
MRNICFVPLSICVCVNIAFADGSNDSHFEAKLEKTNSYTAEYYAFSGMTNIQKAEWGIAITNFTKCLLLNSNDLRAYYGLGVAYFEKGDLDAAIVNYSHLIQLAPQESTAYLNRGNMYRAKQRFDDAIDDFNKCLRLNPTNDMAYKCRASAYTQKMDYKKALKDYAVGLQLNPDDAKALVSRADLYFKIHQFNEAIHDFTNAIYIDPNYYSANNDYAWFLATCPVATMRNGQQAIKYATKACDLTGWRKWECIDTLGVAFAESGDFEKAIDYEKQAVAIKGVNDSAVLKIQNQILLYRQQQAYHEK